MEIEKFRLMISSPQRTKPELKQILQNLGTSSPDLAGEVKSILDKKFPTWAKPAARRTKAKK
jgi:hypothetical protein